MTYDELLKIAVELSGAYWRLEKYGFVCSHNADDPENEAQAEHWRRIANEATDRIRQIVAVKPLQGIDS